ncbi:monocarboxylate transporter 14-like isoform X1 [Tubulanus polymorphus]|uniref:monocarboxylate transporter 14-like isoform X1 n=1 Tax=Tubulanus polymorphus TaxID=672921 RepID=UPI003DA4589D
MASSIVDEAAKNGNSNLLETIIVISAGLISSFIVGGNYVDGILVAEWVDYFHQGSGVTAWLGTAIIGISSCGAPIATLLIKRFGFRKVFFFAATINASALALTSFVYNIYLAIALRVLAGCSVTFHLCSIGPYLANRFPNQVAIVQGLRTASGSSGILAFPFIINYCLKQYGWRGCCLIIGGIASQQCALGLLFRHWSNKPLPKHEENQETLLEQNNGDKTRRFRDLHQLDLFKQKMFVVFMIHIFIIDAASSVIYVHIVSGTRVLLEISPEQARFTLSAIGLSILFACIVVSLITKHPMIDTFTLYMIMNTLLAIQVCVIPFMKGYVAALTVSASIGILMSAHAALHLLMLLELFGSEYLYMSYSYGFFSGGFGYLLGAPVAGWIYDATGNYAISFYFCAGLLILCVLILIPEWIKHIKKPKQTDENTIEPVTPTRSESSKSI